MGSITVLGTPHAYDLTPGVESQPTLVFVHGWLLSRQCWGPLVDQLSEHYQCLTYDLRGFGQSQSATALPADPVPAPQYTPAAYAQDLLELLQQLGISRAWLVGHSLGGSIALWAAAKAPEIVEGVVCLNAGGGIYVKEAFDQFRAAGQQMVKFRAPWLAHLPLLDWVFSRIMVNQPLTRQWGKQRLLDFVVAHPDAAVRALLDSTEPDQVHLLPQVVSRLQQPVFFVAGQQDQVMELKYVYHLASFHRLFQNGIQNVYEVPDCGHMGMLEQTEAIAQRISTLVAQQVVCLPSS